MKHNLNQTWRFTLPKYADGRRQPGGSAPQQRPGRCDGDVMRTAALCRAGQATSSASVTSLIGRASTGRNSDMMSAMAVLRRGLVR